MRYLDAISRRQFLRKGASLAGASALGGSSLLSACGGDSTAPEVEPLALSAVIKGPVEQRSSTQDVSGAVDYSVEGVNAMNPAFDWVVRDKASGAVLRQAHGGGPTLRHEFTGRGTHVIDVTMRDADGRTASTRFETQFLGPRTPYDLIAVVRSEPGAQYGFLNFLDPEQLSSLRQEVLQEDDNIRANTVPALYTNAGLTQAADGRGMLFVTDRDFPNLDPHRVIHRYQRISKYLEASSFSSVDNVHPAWGTGSNELVFISTENRVVGTGEFEPRFFTVRYISDPITDLVLVGGTFLSDHSGLHEGPHKDFFGKHTALHPDGFTVAFGPAPFDGNNGEVRRVALYNLTERVRRQFPAENALADFLNSQFPGIDPSQVRVGENGVAFTPDGERMAFNISIPSMQRDVLAMGSMISGDIELFAGDGRRPSFSPDGNRIGYLNSDHHLLIAPVYGNNSARDATVESGGQGKHDTDFVWKA